MKGKIIKVLALGFATIMMLNSSTINSRAWAVHGIGSTFTNNFQTPAEFDNGHGNVIYGFNIFLINEVYIRSRHDLKGHTARVQVGNGTPDSKDGSPGQWSGTAQRIHQPVSIWYSVIY